MAVDRLTGAAGVAGAIGARNPTGAVPSELLFVDPSVSDIGTLLGCLRPEVEAIVLDAVRPAARQMAATLAGRSQLDVVHVIAHGAPGRVNFAAGELSAGTLKDDADDLAIVGTALTRGGDLNLWSCATGAGADGKDFVGHLADATGTSIAAATGLVGAAIEGGRWELEKQGPRAAIRPPLTEAGVAAYVGVLATLEIIVSGRIPDVPTAGSVAGSTTYFVVDKDKSAIVGHITLPNTSMPPNTFRIAVRVPSASERFDVGVFDNAGGFVSAGFTVETPENPSGAVGQRG